MRFKKLWHLYNKICQHPNKSYGELHIITKWRERKLRNVLAELMRRGYVKQAFNQKGTKLYYPTPWKELYGRKVSPKK